jgi:hypothetical protein
VGKHRGEHLGVGFQNRLNRRIQLWPCRLFGGEVFCLRINEGKRMKATRLISVMISFIVFSVCGFAQPPAVEWSRTYGGSRIDGFADLDVTLDGGYILAGTTWSSGAGDGDFWLLKTSDNGDSLWSRTFGGGCWEECYSVQQTNDGGFILGGTECSFGTQRWDAWIVRTDPDGDSLWSRIFSGPGDDNVLSIRQTSDGGYLACGLATWFDSVSYRAFLMKLDSNGDSVWSRPFLHAKANSVYPLENGDCVVGGLAISNRTGRDAFWLFKTDENGDSLWSRTYERDSSRNECYSMCQTSDGGFILGGLSISYITGWGDGDFWMVKTDADGDSLWSRNFGSNGGNEECYAISQTSDSGYILVGVDISNANIWIVKSNVNGDEMWNQSFGSEDSEGAYAVQQVDGGGYIIGGFTDSYGAGTDDGLFIKINPEMSVPNTPIPERMCFLSNYPNPFNSTTILQFAVPRASRVMIRAYDVLGREIDTITDAVYPTGEHSISWRCPDCASGVYWILMSGDGFQQVRKTILLR